MENDILLVTAFFDIGRGDYSSFKRSTEKYLSWFSRWARIKNDLVIYLQDDVLINKVKEIRNSFGMLKHTKIIKVEDVRTIEPDLLARWEEVERDKEFINFRKFKTNPENIAMYNYINLLKSYFIKDTADNYSTGYEQICWIDFGFEHGGEVFADENDYDFHWEYNFGNKINLFYKNEITSKPIFKMVEDLGPDCILGPIFIVPVKLANQFWQINLDCAHVLADMGFMDDDQLIYLMAYRKKPDYFEMHESDWFLPINDYGDGHFKLKKLKQPSLWNRIKSKVKHICGIQ